jgi:predicted enzyme related to lactoylglutathione lyase
MASLVLYASDLAHTSAFYEALGMTLEPEQHDGGLPHAVTHAFGPHFAIHQAGTGTGATATPWRSAASTFFGFYVDDLDAVVSTLTEAGAPVVTGHQQRAWGCRYVLADPDGRPVEINQKGHCQKGRSPGGAAGHHHA